MKNVWMKLRVGALVLVAGALFGARAEAAPIVSFSPVNQVVNVGDAVSVDVIVSNMAAGETVAFFDLFVTFNQTRLTPTGYIADPGGNMSTSGAVIPPAGFTGVGFFQLAMDAGFDESEAGLSALQVPGFVLATLNFTAATAGVSAFVITQAELVDYNATTLTDASGGQGSVTVNQPGVPEPATLLLLGTGAGVLALRRRFGRA